MAEVLSPSALVHGNRPSSVVVDSKWTSTGMLMAMPRYSKTCYHTVCSSAGSVCARLGRGCSATDTVRAGVRKTKSGRLSLFNEVHRYTRANGPEECRARGMMNET
jgi:hypothetical protein